MLIRFALVAAIALTSCTPQAAMAQAVVAPPPFDTTSLATKSDVAAVAAEMPKPAITPPLPETTTANVGPDPTHYALDKHTHPRMTWSPVVTTVAGATFSGAMPAGMFNAVTIDLSWVAAGSLPVTCRLTSYTTTTFAGICHTLSLVSILAAGAGIEVHVVVLPRSGV